MRTNKRGIITNRLDKTNYLDRKISKHIKWSIQRKVLVNNGEVDVKEWNRGSFDRGGEYKRERGIIERREEIL